MLKLLLFTAGVLCLTQTCIGERNLIKGVFTVPFKISLLPLNSSNKYAQSTEACSHIQDRCGSSNVTSLVSCILNSKLTDALPGYLTSIETSTSNKIQRLNSSDHWLVFSRTSLDNSNEDDFTQALNSSLYDILTQLRQCLPVHGYKLDEPRYKSNVKSSLNEYSIEDEAIATDEGYFLCGPSVCASMKNSSILTDNCYYNITKPGSKPFCWDKCLQYLSENDCTAQPALYGIYLTGTCQYDKYYNPYCDCGTSVGGILQNFYDGNQCVNATFIVAMSASAGGFILLLLVFAIIVVYRQRQFLVVILERNAELQKRSAKYARTDNEYEGLDMERRHPTLSAVIGESATRKNSYEFRPGKKFENQYDGSDLYPYLKKDQFGGGSPRAQRSSNTSSGNSSMNSSGVSNNNISDNSNNNFENDNSISNNNNMDTNFEKLTSL